MKIAIEDIKDKRVLLGILDWGLGHASRSVVVMQRLLDQGCNIWVACTDEHRRFLEMELVNNSAVTFLPVFNHDIQYDKYNANNIFGFATVWKLLKGYRSDAQLADKYCVDYEIDICISDSRLGWRSTCSKNVIVSHQLQPILLLDGLNKPFWNLLASIYNKFDTVWVPDFDDQRLSGKLSDCNAQLANKVMFIGPLSRFDAVNRSEAIITLALLSGPEPLRTEFEQQVIKSFDGPDFVLVRGTRIGKPLGCLNGQSFDVLSKSELEKLFTITSMVIARSGYSTIMDLYCAGITNVQWYPTPGQTEQEYLAQYHSKN